MRLPAFLTQDSDGEVLLTGHRVGLYSVVRCHREGYSPERIRDEFPTLSLDQIAQVLAFYDENRAEVDEYVAAYREDLDRQAASLRQGPGPEELRRRWQEKGLGNPS